MREKKRRKDEQALTAKNSRELYRDELHAQEQLDDYYYTDESGYYDEGGYADDEYANVVYEQEGYSPDEYYDDEYYDDYGDEYYDDYMDEYDEAADRKSRRMAVRRERRRKLKITLIIMLVLLIVLGTGVTVAAYLVSHSSTNFPNVYVDGVFVGEMDTQQTMEALRESGWEETSAIALKVTLMDAVSFDVDQVQSGARHTMQQAADAAYAFGHGGNWFKNLADYVICHFRPVDVNEASLVYNRDYVLSMIDKGIEDLNAALGSGDYEVDEENSVLRMVKGAGQLEFDKEAFATLIFTALEADKTELSYSEVTSQPKAPDFQAIFDKLSAEPADAYYSDDNRFTVTPHVVGCDFDVEEAKDIWTAAELAKTVEIPLEIVYPEVTTEYLEGLLFRDQLGFSATYYPNSVDNRISNLNKAADAINGIILYPGDVFSYNETLGQRTLEAGFLPAGAYENGEVVEEVGGGICQISSTLYSAMLYGYKLTTVERYPHYFPVDYLEKGYDATVSWPSPDFKFRNDRDFPIKIVCYYDNNARGVAVEIWGTNLDGHRIELKKETLAYNNAKYPWIHEGYGVQVFRYVYDANGMQVDQINEIYDIYHTHEATEQIKALDAQAAAQAAAGVPMG